MIEGLSTHSLRPLTNTPQIVDKKKIRGTPRCSQARRRGVNQLTTGHLGRDSASCLECQCPLAAVTISTSLSEFSDFQTLSTADEGDVKFFSCTTRTAFGNDILISLEQKMLTGVAGLQFKLYIPSV